MKVAALYVDVKRGPYMRIPDVECWGIEQDATRYAGPLAVVAHPPCAHWGRYHQRTKDDGSRGLSPFVRFAPSAGSSNIRGTRNCGRPLAFRTRAACYGTDGAAGLSNASKGTMATAPLSPRGCTS